MPSRAIPAERLPHDGPARGHPRLAALLRRAGLLFLLNGAPAFSEGLDLHWLWDDRCAECHGHSADFARRLTWANGELVVSHPVRDPLRFLRNHYPPTGEVEALYRMLQAQATTPPSFRAACGDCHDSAAGLVRASVEFRNGEAMIVGTDRTLIDALAAHRGLDAVQRAFFGPLLTRVAREVHRP